MNSLNAVIAQDNRPLILQTDEHYDQFRVSNEEIGQAVSVKIAVGTHNCVKPTGQFAKDWYSINWRWIQEGIGGGNDTTQMLMACISGSGTAQIYGVYQALESLGLSITHPFGTLSYYCSPADG